MNGSGNSTRGHHTGMRRVPVTFHLIGSVLHVWADESVCQRIHRFGDRRIPGRALLRFGFALSLIQCFAANRRSLFAGRASGRGSIVFGSCAFETLDRRGIGGTGLDVDDRGTVARVIRIQHAFAGLRAFVDGGFSACSAGERDESPCGRHAQSGHTPDWYLRRHGSSVNMRATGIISRACLASGAGHGVRVAANPVSHGARGRAASCPQRPVVKRAERPSSWHRSTPAAPPSQ